MGKKRPGSSSAIPATEKRQKLSKEEGGPAETRGTYGAYAEGKSEEQEDFPRGGRGVLSTLEKRVIREKAMRGILFNEGFDGEGVIGEGGSGDEGGGDGREGAKSPVRGRRTASGVEKRPSITLSKKRVPVFSQKTIPPGLLILGAVREISELELLVSLPHNMTGTVAISNVSDPVTEKLEAEADMEEKEEEEDGEEGEEGGEEEVRGSCPSLSRLFHKGQLVVCLVLGSEVGGGRGGGKRRKRKGVEVSVNPRVVNEHISSRDIAEGMVFPGWVRSVEDHGYIVDFGVAGKSGFLLRKNASEFIRTCNRGKPLVLGQVIRCKFLSNVDARSVPVTIAPALVGGALMGEDSLVQLKALQPGMLVNTAVKETLYNGVLVSFLGGFEGSVSARHLPSLDSTPDSLPLRKKVKGRILWVDVEKKAVGLTLQKTIVSGQSFSFPDVMFGDKYEDVEVLRVYHDSSLLLSLSPGLAGYAPPNLISDESEGGRGGRGYGVGTRHACRVVQFNLLDGVAIVSLQPSVVRRRYMRYSDIAVGDVMEGVVEKVGEYGMIVSIQGRIQGLCPSVHVSDARRRVAPSKRPAVGAAVKCRVLAVEPEERRVLLTCKRSLLALEAGDLLTEYGQATPGRVVRGVVGRVMNRGCSVLFFNHVSGFVSLAEMSTSVVPSATTPASFVREGQSVDCRVLECNVDTAFLRLSLRLDRHTPPEGTAGETTFTPGTAVTAEVIGVAANDGLSLRCPATGEVGFLPTQHLSDYPLFCSQLLSQHQVSLEAAVREGTPYLLSGVLVVCGKLGMRPVLLSMKHSLVKAAATGHGWPSDFSQLQVNQLLVGFVKKVMLYGCFVEFPHGLSALSPSKFLADEFVTDPGQLCREGQTVFAKVLEVDEEKKRFLVSLRQSDLLLSLPREGRGEGEVRRELEERLERYLGERETVMAATGDAALSEEFTPGRVISGKVSSIEEGEVSLEMEGGVPGRAFTHSGQGVSVEVGRLVDCCVVEVEGGSVVVSLNPRLVDGCREPTEGSGERIKRNMIQQAMLLPSTSLVGQVEYISPHYLLLSVPTLAGTRLAYGLVDTGQLGLLPLSYKHVKIGQRVSAVVHSPASVLKGEQKGPPIVIVTQAHSVEKRGLRSTSGPSFMAVQPGDIISVIVQSVKTTYLTVKYHLWRGRVHCCLATDEPCAGHTPFADTSPGDVIKARVVKKREIQLSRNERKPGATLTTLELTTKRSLLDSSVPLCEEELLREKLSIGEELFGFVGDVSKKGVFVHLGTKVYGFVPKTLASKDSKVNLQNQFAEGEAVKCTVVCRSKRNRQYILSLVGIPKRRFMQEAEMKEEEEEEEEEEVVEDEEEMDEEEVVEEEEEERPTLQLPIGGGFVWSDKEEEGEVDKGEKRSDEEEAEDETKEKSSKRSRRHKKAAQKAEEKHLYMTERALLDDSRAPESSDDFERLLLSHPSSSALWVQYMAFLLHTAEVDSARAVGKRALDAISFREEGEKLNTWVAMMNLENLYGSQDSLMEVFRSALQQNEPIEVFRRLAAIYQQSGKMDLAEKLYQTMTRRFRSELTVWTQFGQLLMKMKKLESARRLLQRCLKALTLKKQQVEAISKFAQLEFHHGEVERGKTMFESLLASYPHRTDLWSVYVDMLVKAKEVTQAREVLERALHLKLSARTRRLIIDKLLGVSSKIPQFPGQ